MSLETDILLQITCTYLASKDPEGMLEIAKLVSTSVSKSGEDQAKTCAHIIKIYEGLVECYKERINEERAIQTVLDENDSADETEQITEETEQLKEEIKQLKSQLNYLNASHTRFGG